MRNSTHLGLSVRANVAKAIAISVKKRTTSCGCPGSYVRTIAIRIVAKNVIDDNNGCRVKRYVTKPATALEAIQYINVKIRPPSCETGRCSNECRVCWR